MPFPLAAMAWPTAGDRPRSVAASILAITSVAGAITLGLGTAPARAATFGITEYALPTAASNPVGIVAGPDGNLWYAERGAGKIGRVTPSTMIGRITPSGAITEIPALNPYAIAVGPDGNLWFTDGSDSEIGRALVSQATALLLPSGLVPRVIPAGLADTVLWLSAAAGTRYVTDTSGMKLFASGPMTPGTVFALAFPGAGTFRYAVTGDKTGTVTVPVTAHPAHGATTTTFTIAWALRAPPPGYVFDVQVKRPGSRGYVTWRNGVTSFKARFIPDQGRGTYRVRARIRSTTTGAASAYSTTRSISVT